MTVSPSTGVVVPFGAIQLTATLKNGSGTELSGRTVSWSSSNDAIANVSSARLVTGVSVGMVTVTATAEGKTGSATIATKEGKALGTSGGTVTGLNGTVTLVIPPGALTQLTNITIEAPQGLPVEPRLVAGTGVALGPAGTTFATPVGLTIRYDSAKLPPGTHPDSLTLDIYANGFWSPVTGAAIDTNARTATAGVGQLSTFGVLTPGVFSALEVRSTKLRFAVFDFDICAGQSYAVTIVPTDATGNPVGPHAVTAASGNSAVATVKQIGTTSDQFFMHGVTAGNATITFASGAISQPVTARVVACPKPAVLSTSDQDGNLELYKYAGGSFSRLTNDSATDSQGQVSPDGTTIGFQSDRVGGETKLYLMGIDGSNVRPLLTSQGFQRELAWVPGGGGIVWVGPKPNGTPGIYRVNVDGTGATLLTPNLPTEEGFPAVSPGGANIAFQQRDISGATPGPSHVMVMKADGSALRQLVDNGGADDVTPSFSPLKPGNPEIVFVRNTTTSSIVFRVRLNGAAMGAVAGGLFYYQPRFCQDGEHVMVIVSSAPGVGPYRLAVKDAWIPGSDEPVYVLTSFQQYFQTTYFPQPPNPSLAYGCNP